MPEFDREVPITDYYRERRRKYEEYLSSLSPEELEKVQAATDAKCNLYNNLEKPTYVELNPDLDAHMKELSARLRVNEYARDRNRSKL